MGASKPLVQKKSSRGDPSRQPSVIDIEEEEIEKSNDDAESSESELS